MMMEEIQQTTIKGGTKDICFHQSHRNSTHSHRRICCAAFLPFESYHYLLIIRCYVVAVYNNTYPKNN